METNITNEDIIRDIQSAKWIRARKPEQVEKRRQAILDAATELFGHKDYGDITLNEIAERAQFTKSNLYRYFATREEIFLALYSGEVQAWAHRLEAALGGLDTGAGSARVARVVTDSLLASPTLLGLLPLVAVSLERNASEEALLDNRRGLAASQQVMLSALGRVLPDMEMPQLQLCLDSVHALAAGLWPSANPGQTLQRVLLCPELEHMRVDFRTTKRSAVTALLDGLRKQSNNRISLQIVRRI